MEDGVDRNGITVKQLENVLHEKNVRMAKRLEQEVKALLNESDMRSLSLMLVGEKLYMIREQKLFKLCGFESFKKWSEDTIPSISDDIIERCIDLYKQSVEILCDLEVTHEALTLA
jgi:hypothetical protein